MMQPSTQEKSEKSTKLARLQTYKLYYESKIACLSNNRLSPALHLLACKDAPVERGNIESSWQRGRYIKKCLRFYKKKLNELEKELKKV
ncbi:MAG: hypothetical protein HY885_13350 [Deltaproteobacteria bacterium]|nr:hypothetical protein [Deltaproteobacteria bacterium]